MYCCCSSILPLDEVLLSLLFAPAAYFTVPDLFYPIFFLFMYLDWIGAADFWVFKIAFEGFQEVHMKYWVYSHCDW